MHGKRCLELSDVDQVDDRLPGWRLVIHDRWVDQPHILFDASTHFHARVEQANVHASLQLAPQQLLE
jgi:hypothetical protein